ncbi:MAG TPA: sulfotransferase [Burkholderiales bacterium]|nr:sulfotransferase [Burkholderiales bacterium]
MRKHLNDVLLEARILQARLGAFLTKGQVEAPVFLIGCGRSGKSILGTALRKHSQICFLDESRPLWIASFPRTDIWTAQARKRDGSLYLDERDAHAEGSLRLRRLFYREAVKCGRPLVVQALAANNFRIRFLHRIFPDARFIHVTRNGLHVSHEIAERAERKGWYGRTGHKWMQLAAFAASRSQCEAVLPLCESHFERALLEWRLGMEAVREGAAMLPFGHMLELRYEELIARPQTQLHRIAKFIALEDGTEWATRNASLFDATRALPVHDQRPSDRQLKIGGPDLQAWLP